MLKCFGNTFNVNITRLWLSIQEFSPGSNGRMTTMGVYVRDLLLGQVSFLLSYIYIMKNLTPCFLDPSFKCSSITYVCSFSTYVHMITVPNCYNLLHTRLHQRFAPWSILFVLIEANWIRYMTHVGVRSRAGFAIWRCCYERRTILYQQKFTVRFVMLTWHDEQCMLQFQKNILRSVL